MLSWHTRQRTNVFRRHEAISRSHSGPASAPAIQVGELADVMDFHVLRGPTRLARVRQDPPKQFGPAQTLAGQRSIVD
jgi:hypothetical protein